MKTIIFEADISEIEKIKNVLKALGVKKIKEIESSEYHQFDKVEYTKEEFGEMLDFSRKTKSSIALKTKKDVVDFINSL